MDHSILKNLFGLNFSCTLLTHELVFYGISYITEGVLDFSRSHSFHELLISLSGDLGVDTDGNIVTAHCGELLYIGPQVQRRLKIFPDVPVECVLIDFDIVETQPRGEHPNEGWITDEKQLVRQLCSSPTAICRDSGAVKDCIDRLCAALRDNLVGTPSRLPALLSELLLCAMQCFSGCSVRQKPIAANESVLTNKAIRINEYICSNFMHDITVQSVASALNYSPRHLQRIIMEYYSVSFSDLLIQYRLAMAKSLLGLSDYSIETVSEKCGFSSIRSFEKNFKERLGITPTAFRKIFGKV